MSNRDFWNPVSIPTSNIERWVDTSKTHPEYAMSNPIVPRSIPIPLRPVKERPSGVSARADGNRETSATGELRVIIIWNGARAIGMRFRAISPFSIFPYLICIASKTLTKRWSQNNYALKLNQATHAAWNSPNANPSAQTQGAGSGVSLSLGTGAFSNPPPPRPQASHNNRTAHTRKRRPPHI